MSNTYTHVAFIFDAATTENARSVGDWLRRDDKIYVEAEQHEHLLFVTSESADVPVLVKALRRVMRTMPNIPSPQGFEWSFSGDRHRIGDFGGGAVVLRREPGAPKFISTTEWLKQELKQG